MGVRFRPCIDLKEGKVVQIVGGSLKDGDEAATRVNFTSDRGAADYAQLYKRDGLRGGHVIALGPGNRDAALAALGAWPGGMQYGGGVDPHNAAGFLEAGASHVIVTSYVFREAQMDLDRLKRLNREIGRERLVLDLSCRWRDGAFWIVTERWQRFSEAKVEAGLLEKLADYCAEFLVHGVDVEGRMQGIQCELIELLGEHSPLPVTYAGGVNSLDDLDLIRRLGRGRVDFTIGSALDIFGGPVRYDDVLAWQQRQQS